MPLGAWYELATAAEFLPAPPITRNQIDLKRYNNLASSHTPGLTDLGIEPMDIEQVVGMIEAPR